MGFIRCLYAIILALSLGCGGGEGDPTLSASGVVTYQPSYDAVSEARLRAIWMVSSASPDYIFAFGRGTATGGSFSISFDSPPPPEALNDIPDGGGIGVATLVILNDAFDAALPEGRASREQVEDFDAALVGATARYAIIYVAPGADPSVLEWEGLSEGYNCAEAVEQPEATFESFRAVDCSQMELIVGDPETFEWANWT